MYDPFHPVSFNRILHQCSLNIKRQDERVGIWQPICSLYVYILYIFYLNALGLIFGASVQFILCENHFGHSPDLDAGSICLKRVSICMEA